jgi:hypothetical protein
MIPIPQYAFIGLRLFVLHSCLDQHNCGCVGE